MHIYKNIQRIIQAIELFCSHISTSSIPYYQILDSVSTLTYKRESDQNLSLQIDADNTWRKPENIPLETCEQKQGYNCLNNSLNINTLLKIIDRIQSNFLKSENPIYW